MTTTPLDNTNPNSNSYWTKFMESEWTDAVLIIGFVALLIIGIVASIGAFPAIGTTNAACLAYGMYVGAALLLIVEIAKWMHNYSNRYNYSDGIHFQCESLLSSDIDAIETPQKFRSPVPLHYVSPSKKRSDPLSPDEIKYLKERAQSYASVNAVQADWSKKENAMARLRVYMHHIIDEVEFQNDPIAYMEVWIEARGGTEVLRGDEDRARSFFKNYFDNERNIPQNVAAH